MAINALKVGIKNTCAKPVQTDCNIRGCKGILLNSVTVIIFERDSFKITVL